MENKENINDNTFEGLEKEFFSERENGVDNKIISGEKSIGVFGTEQSAEQNLAEETICFFSLQIF